MCTRSNTCFLGPVLVHMLNGISIGSAVSAQLTAESPYTLVTLQWAALFPQNCPFAWRDLGPHLLIVPWAHHVNMPNGISIGSAVFAQITTVSLYFTMGCPASSKLSLPIARMWTPWRRWFPGPTQVLNLTASRSVQPFLQGSLVRQTDRQTEHVTPCVTIGRIYVVLKLTIDKLREESRRWRFHFLSKPGNEVASIIPSPRIFHSLTAFKRAYNVYSRYLLLLNFNANTVNAYANLSTCTTCAVLLACDRSARIAAYCVTLRRKQRNVRSERTLSPTTATELRRTATCVLTSASSDSVQAK